MFEPLEFSRDIDGTVRRLGDHWPERIRVAEQFIEYADASVVEWGEGAIVFKVANGEAVYRVDGHVWPQIWTCSLVEAA